MANSQAACQADLELIESDGRIGTMFDGVRVALVAVAQESIGLMCCDQLDASAVWDDGASRDIFCDAEGIDGEIRP